MREAVRRAVEVLRRGGLAAFPTETVYGLGADATRSEAVRRIFAAKGRPASNPLIVHVADAAGAEACAGAWPESARRLAERFWPGPLTIVVAASEVIAAEATAGGPTVGLRVPRHPLALELLRAFGRPVAAPSANRSNHVSPTTADHVREELGDAVEVILDGGPCNVGIESTVVRVVGGEPAILRPGGVSREAIEAAIGPVRCIIGHAAADAPAASPGQQPIHYAPRTITYRFSTTDLDALAAIAEATRCGVMAFADAPASPGWARRITMPHNPPAYARAMYASLRDLDASGLEAIYLEMPPDEPQWAAIRDRLMRASRTIPPPTPKPPSDNSNVVGA